MREVEGERKNAGNLPQSTTTTLTGIINSRLLEAFVCIEESTAKG